MTANSKVSDSEAWQVVNPPKAGQGLCTVECQAETDVCRTTTVVFIAPAKCDKVHVATL